MLKTGDSAFLKSEDSNCSSAGAPAIARTGLAIITVFLVQGTEEQGIELIGTCHTKPTICCIIFLYAAISRTRHDATSFPISQASIKATETQSVLQQKLKTEFHKT